MALSSEGSAMCSPRIIEVICDLPDGLGRILACIGRQMRLVVRIHFIRQGAFLELIAPNGPPVR